jgi:hypothetical protein
MKFVLIIAFLVPIVELQIIGGIRKNFFDLNENYYCGYNSLKYYGKCKKFKDCSNVVKNDQQVLEICKFNYQDPSETLVCCSSDDFYKSQEVKSSPIQNHPLDFETCIEKYKNLRMSRDESAIVFTVNGEQVNDGEFCHSAALGWYQIDYNINWKCGGSLITESFVVTAAHCTNVRGENPQVVRIGDIDLTSTEDDNFVQQLGILNVIPHPQFDEESKHNDIALIQVDGSFV